MVVIREQTEGEYSALEHESIPGVVECLKVQCKTYTGTGKWVGRPRLRESYHGVFQVVTAEKSRRIAKFAFDYATRHGRKKVTCVHKANIMKLGDGLFLREGGTRFKSHLYLRHLVVIHNLIRLRFLLTDLAEKLPSCTPI